MTPAPDLAQAARIVGDFVDALPNPSVLRGLVAELAAGRAEMTPAAAALLAAARRETAPEIAVLEAVAEAARAYRNAPSALTDSILARKLELLDVSKKTG